MKKIVLYTLFVICTFIFSTIVNAQSAYIVFSSKSPTQIAGYVSEIGINFSASSTGTDDIEIELELHNKRIIAKIGDKEASINGYDTNNSITSLTNADIIVLDKFLSLMSEQSIDPTNQTWAELFRTVNLLSSWPIDEPLTLSIKNNKLGNIIDLCGKVNQEHTGGYPVNGVWTPLNEPITVGPYPWSLGDCIGRCGVKCGGDYIPTAWVYSQDCFNHDVCVEANDRHIHGDCNSIFFTAARDYLYGPSCDKDNIDIVLNNSDTRAIIQQNDNINIDISVLFKNANTNKDVEYWLYAETPLGDYWYDNTQWQFSNSPIPYSQGKLQNINENYNGPLPAGFPLGVSTFYFAVDLFQDGKIFTHKYGRGHFEDAVEVDVVATASYSLTVSTDGQGTITSTPQGIDCGTTTNTCSASYQDGEYVTLTAVPDSGWDFYNWSGCDSTSGSTCSLTMTSNKTVTAVFTPSTPTTPSVPANLAVNQISNGLRITWDSVSGATTYKIYWGTDSSVSLIDHSGILITNTTVYEHTNLQNGTTYYYGVQACNSAGCSSLSALKFATYGSSTQNLTVHDFLKTASPIYADPQAGKSNPNFDAEYKVKNSASTTITIEQLALAIYNSTNNFLFDMFDLQTGQDKYYYNVKLNPNDSFHFQKAYAYFNSPGSFKVVAKAKINGSWIDLDSHSFIVESPVTTNYTLTVDTIGNGTVSSSPSGINCGFTCNAAYASGTKVTLTAMPDTGLSFSHWSGCDSVSGSVCDVTMSSNKTVTATFTQTVTIPSVPTNLSVNQISNGLRITWDSVSGATTYNIYWGNDNSVSEVNKAGILTTSSTVYEHTGLTNGATYFYRAQACNSAGCSSLSGIEYATYGSSTQNLTVHDFWKKNGPIYADPQANTSNPNFDAQYKVKNSASTTMTIEQLALAIHDSSNKFLFDMFDLQTGQSKHYYNVRLSPNNTFHFQKAYAYFNSSGNFKVVAKAKINGSWIDLDSLSFVVDSPLTTNYTLTLNKTGNGTVSSNPSGINCGSTCNAVYASGTTVTLTATPDTGWSFSNWSGCDSVTGSVCDIKITSNRTATATFTQIIDNAPYFSPSPTLASTVQIPNQISFTGTAKDDNGLKSVSMKVSGPRGSNITAFTDPVSGLSKSLSGYYFDSNNSSYSSIAGTYTVELIITDTANQTASKIFSVTVTAVDNAPYFNPSPTLASTVQIPNKIYFSGTAKDDNGLKYVSMKVSGPRGSSITAFTDSVSGLSKSLSGYYFDSNNSSYAGIAGNYTVELIITDTAYQTASKAFSVTVTAVDNAPYFSPSPSLSSTVQIPNRIYFSGTAKDDKGLKSVSMKVSGPRGSNITAFTDSVSGLSKSLSGYYFDSNNSSYAGIAGNYTVELIITDTAYQTASKAFSVSVTAADNAPYFNPTPTLASTVLMPNRTYFTGTARDDIGLRSVSMKVSGPRGSNILAFTDYISGLSKSLSGYYFDSNNSNYAGYVGTYSVELIITDTSYQTASRIFTVRTQ